MHMSEKTGNGHNELEHLLDDLKAVVRDGQELLKASVGTFKERARYGAEKTNAFVREKPYYGIGAAFGLGLLAGLLVAGMFKGGGSEEQEED